MKQRKFLGRLVDGVRRRSTGKRRGVSYALTKGKVVQDPNDPIRKNHPWNIPFGRVALRLADVVAVQLRPGGLYLYQEPNGPLDL